MLKRIAEVWATRRRDIKEQSADTMRQLAEATQSQGGRHESVINSVLFISNAQRIHMEYK